MKRVFRIAFLAVVAAIAVLTVQAGPSCAAEAVTLKAISAWPKTAVEYRAWTIWSEILDQMVAKRAPGELKVQLLGGPEVVKGPDQVPALQRGQVDMVYTSGAYYTNVLSEIDALKLSEFTPWEERARGATAYLNDLHQKSWVSTTSEDSASMPSFSFT